MVCRYLSLFSLYINRKMGKNRYFKNVRLAGDHLYGKKLSVHLLSLVMSLMASFCAVIFPARYRG